MKHSARRAAPVALPAEPPKLQMWLPLSVHSTFNPQEPRTFAAGNPRHPASTARAILADTYVVGGRQTLVYCSEQFHAWCEAARVWTVLGNDALEAFLFRALSDHGWLASPEHVRKLVAVLKLDLFWSAPALRCAVQP